MSTTKPCKRGHISLRNRFGTCLECIKIYRHRRKAKVNNDPEILAEIKRRNRIHQRRKYEKIKADPTMLAERRRRDRIYQRVKYEENRSDREKLARERERKRLYMARLRAEARGVGAAADEQTGRCKRDHDSPRRPDNGACVQCTRERARQQYQEIKSDPIKWAKFQERMKANDQDKKKVRVAVWLERHGIVTQKPVDMA